MSVVFTLGHFQVRDGDGQAGMPRFYITDRRTGCIVKDNDGMLTFATREQAEAWIAHFGGRPRITEPYRE